MNEYGLPGDIMDEGDEKIFEFSSYVSNTNN
jgi:hypothetical protein